MISPGISRTTVVSCLLAAISSVALVACQQKAAPQSTIEKSRLTHGQVQMTLVKGQTTQAQVLETFGAPNVTTINESGREVWSYQRHAQIQQANESSSAISVFFFGGAESSSQLESSSRSILLIIEFDENKVVSSFRSRNTSF